MGTASSCRRGRGQNAAQLLFLRCLCAEIAGSPAPDNYNVMPPLPQNCCSTSWFATVYNKLAGGGGGCCVSQPERPAHPIPAFLHVCLLSFLNLLSLPVRFLGRACTGRENRLIQGLNMAPSPISYEIIVTLLYLLSFHFLIYKMAMTVMVVPV
jgi:hypothetical protein